jgi:hypothetical protein
MDPSTPAMFGLLGLCAGMVVLGMVGRWVHAIATTLNEHRVLVSSGQPAKPLAGSLFLLLFIHSGPWALAVAMGSMYYLLSRPHTSNLYWFYGGSLVAMVFMLILIVRAVLQMRRATASSAAPPTTPRTSLGDDTDEGHRLRLRLALWSSIPNTIVMSAIWWESITRAPELFIIFAMLSLVFALFLVWCIKVITFPKPWRVPPKRE